MTTFSDAAIRTAVADVALGVIAGVRDMGTGRLTADLAVGTTEATASHRALVLPTITIRTEYAPHEDAPMQPGPEWFDELTLTVTFTSLLTSEAFGRVAYDLVKATQADAAQEMRLAFSWPGKLAATAGGTATGIVGGVMRFSGMSVVTDRPSQAGIEGGGLYVTDHRFTGTVHTAAPVT